MAGASALAFGVPAADAAVYVYNVYIITYNCIHTWTPMVYNI